MQITLREQSIDDAERFFEIINNPKFIYFQVPIHNVQEERDFLLHTEEKKIRNIEHNYTILLGKKVIGGCGIKIRQHRSYIGEIGYFIDEHYWGKGYATKAVKELEQIGFRDLSLHRIEIWMQSGNSASEQVAIKNNYQKEGTMKQSVYNCKTQNYHDAYLYAKTKDAWESLH
jgi:ribosomal-protein-alanine N-acetyltransferase